ncbi:MAG: hypothetical protein Faunusvirus14_2 [Faunusvirus sp.]|jgi:hypothetical protein|uniref:BTB domain-containing protein n=1 Tax=Faunusvirus sp. TaxID=2487766 RepID=A0A3G4ZX19_9VIRU|nr:MAG: hypothetical protein Faunusvirus14_2 [Faunusvirus sp.]
MCDESVTIMMRKLFESNRGDVKLIIQHDERFRSSGTKVDHHKSENFILNVDSYIIRSQSSYIDKLLTMLAKDKKEYIIDLSEYNKNAVIILFRYIYCREPYILAHVSWDTLFQLLNITLKFQIDGYRTSITKDIIQNTTPDNAIDILLSYIKYNKRHSAEISIKCVNTIVDHIINTKIKDRTKTSFDINNIKLLPFDYRDEILKRIL